MAYMCADSGNLMAIAQQVIQQKQKQQQQQQQQQHMGGVVVSPFALQAPWSSHFHGFPFPDPPPPAFSSDIEIDISSEVEMMGSDPGGFRLSGFGCRDEFESDEWMESLIAEEAVAVPPPPSSVEKIPIRPTVVHTQPEAWAALPPLPPAAPAEDGSADCQADIPPSSLFESLVECARLIDVDPELAAESLLRIRESSSPLGEPPNRTAFYFSEALHHRLSSSHPRQSSLIPEPSPEDFAVCYKTLNDACPYIKFAHLTANQAILDSTESAAKIHIVDFGIIQGVQWAALLQALATRPTGKPKKIKISGIPSPDFPQSCLSTTRNRLQDFARLLDLDFEFIPILTPVEALSKSTFQIDADEVVTVNFMLQLHLLLGKSPDHILRLAKSLRPAVVTVGEFELNLNRIDLPERLGKAVGFYGAIFESLDEAMGRDSEERARVERLLLARQIFGALGIGRRRLRMDDRSNWTAVMERCGFEPLRPSHYSLSQARILLWNYNYSTRYSLDDSSPAFLSLAWDGRPLVTLSAWN